MKLLVVSTAPFIYKKNDIYAYSPYVSEMVIWEKYADQTAFCCPVWESERGLLVSKIPFKISFHYKLKDFDITSIKRAVHALFVGFFNIYILFKAMIWADHIHLRCPGNIGLLGSLVQIFFPSKPKTAKYAGNWDPKAAQPWTYKLQKRILNNTFLTRNMQVLVYGEWEGMSSNIKPFFTATYNEQNKLPIVQKDWKGSLNFVFVGTLVPGKNPLYAIQLVEELCKKGIDAKLNIFGDGIERTQLESYIGVKKLYNRVVLHGNQPKEVIAKAYQDSHFVILPSESEGWPKAIAEGMFWGCVPLARPVSCVPYMLDRGKRGVLLQMSILADTIKVANLIQDEADFHFKSQQAALWSQHYTLELFEKEIENLLMYNGNPNE